MREVAEFRVRELLASEHVAPAVGTRLGGGAVRKVATPAGSPRFRHVATTRRALAGAGIDLAVFSTVRRT